MLRKNNKSCSKKSREGGIAIALLLVAFSISAIVAAYMKYSVHNTFLTRRTIDHERARVFAESALDAAEVQVRLVVERREQGLSGGSTLQEELDALVAPVFTNANGSYVVDVFSSKDLNGTGEWGETNMHGIAKEYMDVLITTGVSNTASGVTAAFQETVRITREPFLRYAIFFDGLLELHPGPLMVVDGDVRSNSNIELWGFSGIKFEGTIRSPGRLDVFCSGKVDSYSSDGRRVGASKKIKVLVDGEYESFYQNDEVLDSRAENWSGKSRAVWGGLVTVGDEVGTVNPPIGDDVENHALIEPPEQSDSVKLSQAKLANKADLYIKVLDTGEVQVSSSGVSGNFSTVAEGDYAQLTGNKDGNSVYEVDNSGWVSVQTDFYDPRESEAAYRRRPSRRRFQRMEMVNIYMDKLLAAYPNHNIVYVEVEDPPAGSRLKPAVRLRNGNDLSVGNQAAGLSVASHRTMYVEGNYNKKNPIPALIAADNLTVLSNGWNDNNSETLKPGGALDTDLHAAVMIGYADPDNPDGKITGGAHNLVRYRENWKRVNYNFTGSYISLWTASDSHALLSGRCYSPPNRNITYDTAFKTTQPPGMPIGYSTPEVLFWKEISWDEALNAR